MSEVNPGAVEAAFAEHLRDMNIGIGLDAEGEPTTVFLVVKDQSIAFPLAWLEDLFGMIEFAAWGDSEGETLH